MPQIMKAEVHDARVLANIAPMTSQPVVGDRIALAAHVAAMRPRRDEGENEFAMMTLQRPQDFAHGGRDRPRHQSAALAALPDLAAGEIDFRPARSYVCRVLRLTLLAPNLVAAILDGGIHLDCSFVPC